MSVENGADEAANESALPDELDQAPEAVAVEYEGKTYTLPPELKDALLRQADYTRKTQDVAQGRKALEAERAEHDGRAGGLRGHVLEAARVVAIADQLARLDQIDWRALQAQDPARAQALWQERAQLKDLRSRAARTWSETEQERRTHSQRASARRMDEVNAQLPRLIADWSPELDRKLRQYGTAQGLSEPEMAQATLQNPLFLKLLHKAHQFDEAMRKQKTQQTFDAAQAARPVTRVGGGGGTASRRTTDASGDALSAEEWVKGVRDRLRNR